MPEPMITIKKADGTTQRVPLSSLKQKPVQPEPAKPQQIPKPVAAEPKQSSQPQKLEMKAEAVKEKTEKVPPAPKVTNDEDSIRLKEGVPARPTSPASQPSSPPRTSSLTFDMLKPKESMGKKDVPSASKPIQQQESPQKQAMPVAAPKVTPPAQTKQSSQPKHTWDTDDHMSLLDESLHQDLPAVINRGNTSLSTTTPVKDVFRNEAAAAQEEKRIARKEESVYTVNQESKIKNQERAPLPVKDVKPMMHDVKPGTGIPQSSGIKPMSVPVSMKRTMGPVEELGALSLQDFRRLGGTVEAMSKILTEKFRGLRKESFLLYTDGVRAWRKSPLYQAYLQVIGQSLKQRRPVDVVLAGMNSLKKEEFEALTEINKQLGM